MTAAPVRAIPSPLLRACLSGTVALVMTALPWHLHWTPFNNYVVLADAFLHGHIWIDWPNTFVDAVESRGRHYIVNDPVPSLLLLPYVAVAGLAANQTLLGGVLAFVAGAAAWRISENLHVPLRRALVLSAFMFAGTDLWWSSMIGDVWFLAQTTAVTFVLLALMELSGPKPKAWLVALYYVLAVGSRFTVAMALPAVAYLVWLGNLDTFRANSKGRTARLTSFAAVVGAYLAKWMTFNFVRWGVVWDAGHTIFYHQDTDSGSPSGSPFSLGHVRMQVYSFFVARPRLLHHWPYVAPMLRGTALTWTSPALIFAFFARKPVRTVLALWFAVVFAAAPSFLYYVNGYTQFGMRHALDFEPFLFVLMLLAARDRLPKWANALAIYSICASVYGVWYWVTYVLPGRR